MRMIFYRNHGIRAAAAFLSATFCLTLYGQVAGQGPMKKFDAKPLPPRAAPADYTSVAKVGNVTIAVEFAGHGVPTPDGVFSTEDYLVVEVGLYGPAGEKMKVAIQDFSLRINGAKKPLPAVPYESTFHSLKDPEWVPPGDPADQKSKGTSIGGNGGQGDPPPSPPKMPLPLVLIMEEKVKKASLQEGDRSLPDAGLLYFQRSGKLSGIRTAELIYAGASGKATLPLQ